MHPALLPAAPGWYWHLEGGFVSRGEDQPFCPAQCGLNHTLCFPKMYTLQALPGWRAATVSAPSLASALAKSVLNLV